MPGPTIRAVLFVLIGHAGAPHDEEFRSHEAHSFSTTSCSRLGLFGNVDICAERDSETVECHRVETRELPRLPSLSWQEQLPPLNVPLQEILVRSQAELRAEEEAQQQ